ncbi:MAG: hypothetical protein FWB86_12615 [Treponema sp.]|nr:hypothetical protein [Treponema sp.]
MFKKISWIVALLAALAVMFVGCRPADDPTIEPPVTGGEWVTVFDLADLLEGKTVGTTFLGAAAEFGPVLGEGGFIVSAGDDVQYEIVADGLSVISGADWSGIDLVNAAIDFKAGDELTIEGRAISAFQIVPNINNNGWNALGGWNPSIAAGGTFATKITIKAGDVGAIRGNAYVPGIRLRTNTAGSKYVITKLIVEGMRGGGAVCECLYSDCSCDPFTCEQNSEESPGCSGSCAACTPAGFESSVIANYVRPTTALAANEFFIDIADQSLTYWNAAVVPTAKVQENASVVKYYFDTNNQIVSMKLSDDERTLVNRVITAGEKFKVVIDGNATYDVADFRYGIGNPGVGSNWNATDLPRGTFGSILEGTLTPSSNTAQTQALILQMVAAAPTVVEIKSIKIILPVTKTITFTDVPIAAPVPGELPVTTFAKAVAGGQYAALTSTGVVWTETESTDALSGAFESGVAYTATAKLTAANDFWTFGGFVGRFKVGDVQGMIQDGTDPQVIDVVFNFPAVYAINFPAGTGLAMQITKGTPPALANVEDDEELSLGTIVTAKYAQAPIGPAESNIVYTWQLSADGSTGWAIVGTGKTFSPAKLGFYRLRITSPGYMPGFSSDKFEAISLALIGELDEDLIEKYVKVSTSTKVWSLDDERGTLALTNTKPLLWNGGAAGTWLNGGINVDARANSYASPILLFGTAAVWGHEGLDVNPQTKKIRLYVSGVIIGMPPAGLKMQIQHNGFVDAASGETDAYKVIGEVTVTDLEGEFIIDCELPKSVALSGGSNLDRGLRIMCSDQATMFRIVMIEVEDKGARE